MKNWTNLFALILIITATTNCNKDDGGSAPPATDTPSVITFTKPTAGTIYINGSSLVVEGEITDVNVLATVGVQIKNSSSGAVLFSQSAPSGNVTFYRFLSGWTVTGITVPTQVTVTVTAVDKLSKTVTKSVDVMLNS
jgi:hypothetical protein